MATEAAILELFATGNFREAFQRFCHQREQSKFIAMKSAKTWEDHQKAVGACEEATLWGRLGAEIEEHEAKRNMALKENR